MSWYIFGTVFLIYCNKLCIQFEAFTLYVLTNYMFFIFGKQSGNMNSVKLCRYIADSIFDLVRKATIVGSPGGSPTGGAMAGLYVFRCFTG